MALSVPSCRRVSDWLARTDWMSQYDMGRETVT